MKCVSAIQVTSKEGERHFVPCGKCLFCLQTKRMDWSFRLLEELRECSSAFFITLTYAVDPLSICKRDLQLFFKRLRKFNSKKIRYYAVGEYGTKLGRPHYHAIVFNIDLMRKDELVNLWSHGQVFVGTVSPASVAYVTKYVINRVGEYPGRDPPFALMSRKPGIGANYLVRMRAWHLEDLRMYAVDGGQKRRLPRFYKDKLFSKGQKLYAAMNSTRTSVEDYWKELEELSHNVDPAHSYDEAFYRKHELMFVSLNDKNKF